MIWGKLAEETCRMNLEDWYYLTSKGRIAEFAVRPLFYSAVNRLVQRCVKRIAELTEKLDTLAF